MLLTWKQQTSGEIISILEQIKLSISLVRSGLLQPWTLSEKILNDSLSSIFLILFFTCIIPGRKFNSEMAASLSPSFFVCSLNLLLWWSKKLFSWLLSNLILFNATLYFGCNLTLKIKKVMTNWQYFVKDYLYLSHVITLHCSTYC